VISTVFRGDRYKGAREITSGSRYHIFSEGTTHTLIINDVYGEDADEYVCRAVNKAGVKSTRAELIIMSKYSKSIFNAVTQRVRPPNVNILF